MLMLIISRNLFQTQGISLCLLLMLKKYMIRQGFDGFILIIILLFCVDVLSKVFYWDILFNLFFGIILLWS